jgi:wobble nucleotide-excising tRNase
LEIWPLPRSETFSGIVHKIHQRSAMTLITRVNHIKNHRIFHDFTWHGDLEDFERYNLIYGWNGSGKSTLSNLFRCLERKELLGEGEVELTIDGKKCLLSEITKESVLPQVRVFNRQFVGTYRERRLSPYNAAQLAFASVPIDHA